MPEDPTIYSNFQGYPRSTASTPVPLTVVASGDTTRHRPDRFASGFYRVRSMEMGKAYTIGAGASNEVVIECCADGARQYFVAYRPDVDSLFVSTDIELSEIAAD